MTAPFKRKQVDSSRISEAARKSLDTSNRVGAQVALDGVLAQSEAAEYQTLQYPIAKIRSNPVGARVLYGTKASDEMIRSLKENGQQSPVTGFFGEDKDTIILIDGQSRLNGAERLGWSSLRVEVRPKPVSDQELYLQSRLANLHRSEQTPLDDAIVWRRLLDTKVFGSQVELSKKLGLSETEVSRTLSLEMLAPTVRQVLGEHPELLSFKMLNAIREFQKAHGEEKTISLLADVVSGELGYREVEARKRTLEQGPRKRERPFSKEFKFKEAQGVIRAFESGGRVELVLKGLNKKEAQSVIKKLEATFKS